MFYIYADGNSIYDPSVSEYYLFDPKLTLEFGKAGALEFSIPSTNYYYNSLKQMKTVVTVVLDDTEIFRGRVLSFETGFNNFKTVYCEGDLAYLVDSVQKGTTYTGTTHALFRKIIERHNARVEDYKKFTVGTITIEDRPVKFVGKSADGSTPDINTGKIDYKQIALDSIVDDWNNTFDFIQETIIDYCGGYLKTRRVGNTTYLDLFEKYSDSATQEIAFGKNILDLKQEVDADDLFTVLIPLGDENLTIAKVNNGSDEISDSAAVARYGRIIQTHVFSNVRDPNTLLENAQRYLANNIKDPLSITVNAIDLHMLDGSINMINIGDRVHINSNPHGLAEYLTCTKIVYDFANPENNEYTFGNPKQTLTQRYREDKRVNDSSYGDSGGGYGGVGSAAEEDILKTVDGWLNNYKEELDLPDPENPDGKFSLSSAYRWLDKMQDVLTREVGIYFDANPDDPSKINVNIQNIVEQVNQNGTKIGEAVTNFQSKTEEIDTKLSSQASMIARVEKNSNEKLAELTVKADEMESAIVGKADKIELDALQTSIRGEYTTDINDLKNKLKSSYGIDADATTGTVNINTIASTLNEQGEEISSAKASIQTLTKQDRAQSAMIAEYKNNTDSKIASITATANALQSEVALKADQVTFNNQVVLFQDQLDKINLKVDNIDAKEINTEKLAAALAKITYLNVGAINASSILVRGTAVPTNDDLKNYVRKTPYSKHSHILTENSDGTITLGDVTDTPQSFNIRATKTYREGVAAAGKDAKITELGLDPSHVIYYDSETKDYTIKLLAKITDENTKTEIVHISGAAAYQAGYNKGTDAASAISYDEGVASVKIDQIVKRQDDTYDSSTHKSIVHVQAKASNGEILNANIATDTRAYDNGHDDGAASVKISEIVKRNVDDTYDSSTHKMIVHVQATASNGETLNANIATDTKAYDAGFNEGKTSGTDAVKIKSVGKNPDRDYGHDLESHVVTVPIKAIATNDAYMTNVLTVNTASHYNAGIDSVGIKSVSKTTETYNTSAHTTTIHGLVELTNNKTKVFDYTTGTDAYDDGRSTVSITSVKAGTKVYSGKTIQQDINILLSNNSTIQTYTFDIDASAIYNSAANSLSIDSLAGSVSANDLTNHTITYSVTADASAGDNTASKTETFTISTTPHYNQGKRDAVGNLSVSIGSGSISSNNLSAHTISYSVSASASAGGTSKSTSKSFTISATPHYNQGYRQGIADAPEPYDVGGPYSTGYGTRYVRVYMSNGTYRDFTL